MPKISRVRSIAALPVEFCFPQRIDCRSSDGEWNLVFHTPREWHMGAEGWKVQLFQGRRDVTAQHKHFFSIAEGKGFRCEPHFQPWSYDNKSLAIVTWDESPVHIYQVASKIDTHLGSHEGYVRSAQWAPDIDRLLVTIGSEAILVDQAGKQRALVQLEINEDEHPHTHWLKTGACFFLLARRSVDTKSRIMFYSGVDGALKTAYDLDPLDLLPYHSQDYVELSRDRFDLVLGPSTRAVASLLDVWSSVRFDQASNTLSLGVYRPVSLPYSEGGELLCKVEQQWVAVELDLN